MNPSFRGGVIASLMLFLCIAAGCTVRPMLASTDAGPGAHSGLAAALDTVSVTPVDTRYAQQVRNELIFLLHGGAAAPAKPRYTLNLTVTATKMSAATIQIANEEEPTAQIMTLRAVYRLHDNTTGKIIGTGTREITSSYDVPRQEYAVVRAEIDAQNRAARELARVLHLTIGQDLARSGVQG